MLADGTTHAIRLSSAKHGGGSPFAGYQSSLVAIDVRDEAVGTIMGAGFAHPVFLSGSNVTTLQVTGTSVAVALGPLVAVSGYVSGDPLSHALVWNPITGSVRDLGQGFANGINADGIVVGQTLGLQAAYWSADGALHNLGFAGALNRVNLFGQAVGFTLRSGPGGGTTPIILDLRRPSVVKTLTLPPGLPFGIPKDISDNGLIVGDAFKDRLALTSEAVLWAGPTTPAVPLQKLVPGRSLKGFQLTDAEGVDVNGLIVGSVTPTAGITVEFPFIAVPPIGPPRLQKQHRHTLRFHNDKLEELNALVNALDTYTGGQAPTGKAGVQRHGIHGLLQVIGNNFDDGQIKRACAQNLPALRELFLSFHFTNESFDREALLQFKQDALGSLDEIQAELRCP